MNIGRKGNSFLPGFCYHTNKKGGLLMITCFFLIIKPESFDAKAHKSVFPVKKKLYFHNRVKVNTLIQTL